MRPNFDFLRHLLDIVLGALVLRVWIGWLWAYPRLFKLLFAALLIGLTVAIIVWLQLYFALILTAPIMLLAIVSIFLSFLPEFTRLYQTISSGNFFRHHHIQSEAVVKEMALALWDLAKLRRGALFVFPRYDEVDGHVSGGEDVEVGLNRSMILSIFNTQSPRHDGAVIVRDGKIVRVGAVMPLASAEGADIELGTRHLAALGLTQHCDASVLVVSEERGVISHVSGGEIHPLLVNSVEELEERLYELLGGKIRHAARRRQRNITIALWIAAAVLAVGGSIAAHYGEKFYYQSRQEVKAVSDIARVEFYNVPHGVYFVSIPDKTIELTIRAPKNTHLNQTPAVSINLANYTPGSHEIPIRPDMVRGLPADCRVVGFSPASIKVTLGYLRVRELPVARPAVTGLNAKFQITELRLVPENVTLEIRDPAWEPGQAVAVHALDLSNITKPGTYERPVILNIPSSVQPVVNTPALKAVIRVEAVGQTAAPRHGTVPSSHRIMPWVFDREKW